MTGASAVDRVLTRGRLRGCRLQKNRPANRKEDPSLRFVIEVPVGQASWVLGQWLQVAAPRCVRSLRAVTTQSLCSLKAAGPGFDLMATPHFLVDLPAEDALIWDCETAIEQMDPQGVDTGWLALVHRQSGMVLGEVSFAKLLKEATREQSMWSCDGARKHRYPTALLDLMQQALVEKTGAKNQQGLGCLMPSFCDLVGQGITRQWTRHQINSVANQDFRGEDKLWTRSREGVMVTSQVAGGLASILRAGVLSSAQVGLFPFGGISGPLEVVLLGEVGGRRTAKVSIGCWNVLEQIETNIENALVESLER